MIKMENNTLLSTEVLEGIRKELQGIRKDLEEIKGAGNERPFRSLELNELFEALALAQGEMPPAPLNKTNPYFDERYTDLVTLIKTARPALSKHKLAVLQQIMPNEDGQMILHTILTHASGQWIESRVRVIPPKNDVRTMDSYITSLKRCAYSAMVGIAGAEDDDDGEYASATEREVFAKGTALNTKYNPKETSLETISKDQLSEVEYELSDYPDIAEMVLDGLKIQNVADIPKDKFRASITKIRRIKNLRDGK